MLAENAEQQTNAMDVFVQQMLNVSVSRALPNFLILMTAQLELNKMLLERIQLIERKHHD